MSSAHYSFEEVRGVATKVLRFRANLRPETDGIWRDFPVVLLIPGNPGEIQIYEEFLRVLYDYFEEQVEVWGVSHAGHHGPPDGDFSFPSVEDNPNMYDVQAQILHKIEFIKNFIGFEREVILIGHSIGCYVAMQVIKREPRLKCEKAILLFPTIERMVLTERAQELIKTVARWYSPLMLFASLLNVTPMSLKRWVCKWIYGKTHLAEAAASFYCKHAISSSWFMAKDEFDKIHKRDDAFIKRSWRVLSFYYGAADGWCPLEYVEDMKRDFPQADITLCDKNIEHAFMLDNDSVRSMADYVAEKCKGVL